MKNNWLVKKLGEICDVRDGTHNSPKYQQDGIPLITSKNLKHYGIDFNNVNYISEKDHLLIDKRSKVDDGDILFGMIGTIGNPVVINSNIKFSIKNVGLIKFTREEVNNYFIYYFLQSDLLKRTINSLSRGGTQNFVSLGDLRNLSVPLPTKQEQKKIVERLDAIRKAQELCDQQIQKTEELFESLVGSEFKSLGGNLKRLKEISIKITKGTTPTTYGYKFTNSGVPFLRVEDIDNGELRFRDTKYHISQETNNFMGRSQTQSDDVLITIAGTIGRVSVVPKDAPILNMNQAVALIRPNSKVLSQFLKLILMSDAAKSQILKSKVTGTLTNLSLTQLGSLEIPLPSLDEQKKIVDKLEAVQNYKKLLQKEKALLKELFDSVLDKCMKGEMVN